VSGGSATVELSVIVPCYNEEGNLPELVERTERVFERRRIRGELVLVNDGSRDGTAAQIEALAARHPCVVGVHHPTNRGIPAGWRSGFERSRGRYVCTIDADLQYQPEAIALLYREMCFSKADLVQGWRSTLERQHDHRYYWSRGLDYLLKLAFAMPEYDVKSGFVLYRREVFEDILREAGRFHYFQHMITVVAKAKGYSIRQVETLFAERHAGQSFIGGFPLTMMSRTCVDIGRAFAAYRLREPKDQTLEAAVGPGPRLATGPVAAAGTWLRDPAITRNAPRYLDELRRTQWLSRAQLAQLQLQRLRRLLVHAGDHVGYWRELFQATGLATDDVRTLDDLRRVPILTKSALRENIYFDLVSDSSIKRKIAKLTTSGNSGEPLAVFVDRLQRDTRWANAMRHREWAGWRVGEPTLRVGHRPVTAAGPVPLRERLQGALARPDAVTSDALDPGFVRQLAERMRRQRTALLEADAEVLRALATLREDPAAEPWARAVVSTGQTLGDELRALVQRRLGARVFGRYGAREFGPVAQECEAGCWHVNAETFIVEIECDGRPAADGELGEVLVTDLTNYCVPLLRYRLGDVAMMSRRRCECGRGLPLLEGICGRPESTVVVGGARRVPSSVFADLLGYYEFAIQRWQVVQPARDRVLVRLVRRSRFSRATEKGIRRALNEALGGAAILELVVADDLPAGDTRPVLPLPLDADAGAPRHEAAS
jgi:phenylacetate-coenzyme A ligase PaaK-like adenylate-forming protein